jgi:hypothetical protein
MPIVSSAAELILTEYILITIRNTYFVSPFSFSEKINCAVRPADALNAGTETSFPQRLKLRLTRTNYTTKTAVVSLPYFSF